MTDREETLVRALDRAIEDNEKLRTEIERLRNDAQSAWKPIDRFNPEADNPNVLVSDQGSVSEAYYDGEADAWFKAGKSEHDFDFVSSDRLYPSHWMPMPAARSNSPEQDLAPAGLQSQSGINRSLSEGTPREGASSLTSAHRKDSSNG